MIEIGDKITFKAICIALSDEGYRFVLEEGPIKENLDIKLSKTDENYNQRVQEILENWKV